MKLIIITGPTTAGKTKVAVQLAALLNGEVISADSRQVYRSMDIGTGKDLSDYQVNGKAIHHHLIDIREAGEEYNLFEYQRDFAEAYADVVARGKTPILAGGTGLYIEAVLKNFNQTAVPVDEGLRSRLEKEEKAKLEQQLRKLNCQQLNFDTSTKKRLIRAIEICRFLEQHTLIEKPGDNLEYVIFCLNPDRKEVLRRIQNRLKHRLDNGMIEEVQGLIRKGVSEEKLKYYGLEYKFIAGYLEKEFTYEAMFERLNVAIRQYAKRQMTWFRRMERNGFKVHWINAGRSIEDQVAQILTILDEQK